MKMFDISKLLSDNAYPGRGIIIGKSKDGKNAVAAYFIMGRSESSLKTARVSALRLSTLQSLLTRISLYIPLSVFSETKLLLQTATRLTPFMSLWTSSRPLSSLSAQESLKTTLLTLRREFQE